MQVFVFVHVIRLLGVPILPHLAEERLELAGLLRIEAVRTTKVCTLPYFRTLCQLWPPRRVQAGDPLSHMHPVLVLLEFPVLLHLALELQEVAGLLRTENYGPQAFEVHHCSGVYWE